MVGACGADRDVFPALGLEGRLELSQRKTDMVKWIKRDSVSPRAMGEQVAGEVVGEEEGERVSIFDVGDQGRARAVPRMRKDSCAA